MLPLNTSLRCPFKTTSLYTYEFDYPKKGMSEQTSEEVGKGFEVL
jgi:hypothetical protein